ncbi:hypothetical protein [Leptolyngbya sp. FACHB-17]|uniref:hypothetical protein n=1 Tax=unclassified Leptolyngbya TaxID=2650499 RepID=UPI00168030EC|nr:hypothetical protein [Leptolyngbya sp. FACHB-17]MBD2078357.1 hypothetical protein [Leptolyngbya sp. FACHB-17]
MSKVKCFYQGKQLSLFPDLLYLQVSSFAMCDIEPKPIRFSTPERLLAGNSKRSQKVRVGLAVASLPEGFAQNGSGCFRVRYLEAGVMHQTDISPD